MNRAERRRKAKEYTPHKFNEMHDNLRWAIRKECQEEADRRVGDFIQSYTTLVIYVLWYKFGIGQKRMKMFYSPVATCYTSHYMYDENGNLYNILVMMDVDTHLEETGRDGFDTVINLGNSLVVSRAVDFGDFGHFAFATTK